MTTIQKIQMKLAGSGSGRMTLHLVCLCRDGKVRWHSRGIIRELRLAKACLHRGLQLLHRCVAQATDSATAPGAASSMHDTVFVRRNFNCGT